MGTNYAASIQTVKAISSLVLTLFFGLSSATSAIIGNEIGAGNEENAYNYSMILLKVSFFCGLLVGLFVLLFSPLILSLMGISKSIYPLTKQIVKSEVFIIVVKSLSLQLLVGILRAGGDVIWTIFMDLIPLWCVAIPITYFTGLQLGWPIYIVYLLSCSDEVIKIWPCIKRLKSKKWINNLVS